MKMDMTEYERRIKKERETGNIKWYLSKLKDDNRIFAAVLLAVVLISIYLLEKVS